MNAICAMFLGISLFQDTSYNHYCHVAYDIRDAIQMCSFSSSLTWSALERHHGKNMLKVLQSLTREYQNMYKVCGPREAAATVAVWGVTANGYKITNTVFGIQRCVLHSYYLYTVVHFVPWFRHQNGLPGGLEPLGTFELGHSGNACCDRDMCSTMTACFWSTKPECTGLKLYQGLGNRMVLCLLGKGWTKRDQ